MYRIFYGKSSNSFELRIRTDIFFFPFFVIINHFELILFLKLSRHSLNFVYANESDTDVLWLGASASIRHRIKNNMWLPVRAGSGCRVRVRIDMWLVDFWHVLWNKYILFFGEFFFLALIMPIIAFNLLLFLLNVSIVVDFTFAIQFLHRLIF